ncbi:mitochondrial carrier protein LEU5 [Xylariomycetidae sp. FL2044]|nr:mitochondrial carrier protein LEU5 [Xylariomycetidae sp. FL2044]KAH9908754.1 mitochondrial carrier protein LEU5 [Xylariomycetidae sp. FL2044]
MPSAVANHASIPEIASTHHHHHPGEQGDREPVAGAKMDGAVREAGDVVVVPRDQKQQQQQQKSDTTPDERPVAAATGTRKRPSQHSTDYIVRSFIAGGLAGCAGKTAVAPLDRVKILFQTGNPQFAKYQGSWAGFGRAIRDIYARDGVPGLFRGHSATLLKIYPYAAIKFVAYEQFRAVMIRHPTQETWLRRFAAGALAGVSSVFVTYPLEVIRVRLAFETKHRGSSLLDICRKIYHEHPLPPKNKEKPQQQSAPIGGGGAGGTTGGSSGAVAKGVVAETATATARAVAPRSGLVNFYRGFSTTLLGMVPYAGVSFLTHDTAGDVLRLPALRPYTTIPRPAGDKDDGNTNVKPPPLRAWAELLAGGVAGVVSQTVSYPLEVVRRRMQVGGAVGDGHRLGIAETVGLILRERGLPGFFVGLTIGYVKVLPMAAVSFYTYERMKTVFGI